MVFRRIFLHVLAMMHDVNIIVRMVVTRMFAGYIRLIMQCVYASMYLHMLHDVRIHVRIACTDVCALLLYSVKKNEKKNTDCRYARFAAVTDAASSCPDSSQNSGLFA